jgi:hypothetical protein
MVRFDDRPRRPKAEPLTKVYSIARVLSIRKIDQIVGVKAQLAAHRQQEPPLGPPRGSSRWPRKTEVRGQMQTDDEGAAMTTNDAIALADDVTRDISSLQVTVDEPRPGSLGGTAGTRASGQPAPPAWPAR